MPFTNPKGKRWLGQAIKDLTVGNSLRIPSTIDRSEFNLKAICKANAPDATFEIDWFNRICRIKRLT